MGTMPEAITYTQKHRPIAIDTPLGEDALLLRGFHGQEAISQLFRFDLDLLSTNNRIDFEKLIGKPVTIRVALAGNEQRYFSGVIRSFAQGGRDELLTVYHAEMVPWLWLLTCKADCRIFQNKTTPEIIQQVFAEGGFQDFSMANLAGPFVKREYCVQYRESDFNFVSRLMEDEGIYYFFSHESGKHTMILADTPGGHPDCPEQSGARYHTGAGNRSEDVVSQWEVTRGLEPGTYTLNDFYFEDPDASLLARVSGHNAFEVYDYPGEYRSQPHGASRARVRLQECEAPCVRTRGSSDCRAFTSGYKFKLTEHYRADQNQVHVLSHVAHMASMPGDFRSGGAGLSESLYRNTFTCFPYSTAFRPSRITPKPIVHGSQTAIVVGERGEEITTDKYGRIKVQFHWDRKGKRDENSSCWMRVSQSWAGKNWGGMSIPRIGQEVIVDFLEGDPDQPIVTGRVYNAEEMPPYALPANKDMMGVKSNSTKGGGGYNEIVFRDGKNNELLRMHAQKDMEVTVRHNDTQRVMVDRTIQVDGQHHEAVKGEIVIKSTNDQIFIQASTEISLVVGESKLVMTKDGQILLQGVHVTVVGSTMIDLNP